MDHPALSHQPTPGKKAPKAAQQRELGSFTWNLPPPDPTITFPDDATTPPPPEPHGSGFGTRYELSCTGAAKQGFTGLHRGVTPGEGGWVPTWRPFEDGRAQEDIYTLPTLIQPSRAEAMRILQRYDSRVLPRILQDYPTLREAEETTCADQVAAAYESIHKNAFRSPWDTSDRRDVVPMDWWLAESSKSSDRSTAALRCACHLKGPESDLILAQLVADKDSSVRRTVAERILAQVKSCEEAFPVVVPPVSWMQALHTLREDLEPCVSRIAKEALAAWDLHTIVMDPLVDAEALCRAAGLEQYAATTQKSAHRREPILNSFDNPLLSAWAKKQGLKSGKESFRVDEPVGHFEIAPYAWAFGHQCAIPTPFSTASGGRTYFAEWDVMMRASTLMSRYRSQFDLWCQEFLSAGKSPRHALALELKDVLGAYHTGFMMLPKSLEWLDSSQDRAFVAAKRLQALLDHQTTQAINGERLPAPLLNVLECAIELSPLLANNRS